MTGIPFAICRISLKISNAIISKRKHFFWFFIKFLEWAWNLEYFEKKKDVYHGLFICEIIEPKRVGYLNVKKVLLLNNIR